MTALMPRSFDSNQTLRKVFVEGKNIRKEISFDQTGVITSLPGCSVDIPAKLEELRQQQR